MKIGFFTDAFLPQPNGVSTSVNESAKELERRGHEVFIIAPKFPGYTDQETNVIRIPSVRVSKQPETRLGLSLPNRSLKKILSIEFDIIHGHSGGPVTLLGWEIARLKKIPFVGTYHTLWNRYTHYFLKGKIVTPKMMEKATKIFANRIDHLIAPTKRVEKELRSYGVKAPISVVPSGIDVEKFRRTEPGILRENLAIRNDPILLFVGRLSREKSVDFLLQMFKEVLKKAPNAHFVLIGEGSDKKKLERLANRLGIQKRVHFLGEIGAQDIHKVYADATVFVFSSTTETQGLVILESLSAGVPVVAVDDPAYECIKNGENGFLVRYEKKEFASKVLLLIGDRDLRQKLSNNATLSAKKFSVKTTVNSLEAIYFKLIEASNQESVQRIMDQNERKERFLVVNIAFWATIVATRLFIFTFFPVNETYPKLIIGTEYFYRFTLGLLLVLLSLSFYIKKRNTGLLPLLFLGWGLGWIADEFWSLFNSPLKVSDYWNPLNLFPILTLGLLPLLLSKINIENKPKFYINSKENIHLNPDNPKITVVIPAYNEAEFIGTTLKSILNQTYRNFELIVVDNNSTDNTRQVAEKYGAKVVFEGKKGVASARDKGFREARGEIIVCTDADSIVPENWLEKMVSAYEKEPDLVGFGGLGVLYSGTVTARAAARYLFSGFWFLDKILSGGWNLAGFNMSVKKAAFLKIGGFDTNLTLGEDIDLAERLRSVGKVKIDSSFLVNVSGRRYRFGLLRGVLTYAPSWFMRVVFKKDKFLTFNPVRSEGLASSGAYLLPLGFVVFLLAVLFYAANQNLLERLKLF